MPGCLMPFPEDWHEFLKDYSFDDSQEVYTNGSRLIPVFRVEQLIEHLLKSQEPIEARLNLCESCAKEYAECEADKTDLVYGSGVGNDNIIGCLWYVNRWKAQEPRVLTLEEWREWKRKPLSRRDPVYYVDNKGVGSWIAPNDQLFIYATPELGYGTLFVCWTSRPTDAQREATAWKT